MTETTTIQTPPCPTHHEAQRLRALHSYEILDTPPEPEFDAITTLIAKICQVPIALVSLVDENRQWFKSKCGLAALDSTGRDVSLCSHAIEQASILVINDTLLDRRFRDNPLVVGEPYLRFYAGAPLIDTNRVALGTLCIADHCPRALTVVQWSNLGRLAISVTNLIMARKAMSTHDAVESGDLSYENGPGMASSIGSFRDGKILSQRGDQI